jgi:serine-aspartate repeat-containing protein C/D/E
MEPRCLLAVDLLPLNVGAVYYEDASGVDEAGDLFEITFDGGAPGTQLAELAIQTDKTGDGLTIGDVFFDTDGDGLGAFGAVPLQLIEQTGIDSVQASVADGGTMLLFTFTGFDPGDRLIFSIDVDEQGFLGPNAVAEGNELEGSQLTARLTAPHCFDALGSDIFIDYFQQKLNDSGLDLPPDDYVPPGETPTPVRTAAAVFSLTQTPLPITVAGTVFEDVDLDNTRDPGEPGLPGVKLTLMELQGTQYVPTGQTAVTDAEGNYLFEDLLPGTCQVVETQPDGLYSIGATAGSVGQQQRGMVTGANVISDVVLLGGDDSLGNDFAEARPVALSGNVYHDADNDGVLDPGETGIGGARIHVQYLPPSGPVPAPIELTTAPDGSWSVEGLMPGNYYVQEVQPAGYFDGLDAAGTAGGTAHNPGDMIDGIRLRSGQWGRQYNFGELVFNSISGRVVVDLGGNGLCDPGDTPLAGVTVLLRDTPESVRATAYTDAQGQYVFTGLGPGVYAVEELQPEGYFDGADHVGSAGGRLLTPDAIGEIKLVSGTAAVGYDFCELEPASIGGFVYVDQNNDGVRNLGEAGIAGVKLTLLDGQGLPTQRTAVTDAAGFYHFENLTPDTTYGVAETQPVGFLDGLDTAGTAGGVAHNPGDMITGVVLTAGTHAANYNFGELPPPSVPPPPLPEPPTAPPPTPVPPKSDVAVVEPTPDEGEPLPAGAAVYLVDTVPQSLPIAGPPKVVVPPVEWPPAVLPYVVSPARRLALPPLRGGWLGSASYPWYTWHLSVVNGGRPRRDADGEAPREYPDRLADADDVRFYPAAWMDVDVHQSQWILADAEGRPAQEFEFGLAGGTPVTGDWDGDGVTEIGVYLDGLWFLDLNGNGVWDEGDLWIRLGTTADWPAVGDWDGDGKTDIAVFGPAWPGDGRAIAAEPGLPDIANAQTGRYKNIPPEPAEATAGWRTMKRTSQGNLRADVVDHVFEYGNQGDVPVAGDWNGDGVANIGIFRGGTWFLDADGNGRWSFGDVYVEHFGEVGDVPVVGDFNGDGIDDLGVYRGGTWYLDADGDRSLTAHDKVFRLGGPGDKPAVGDFNGDGIDEIAVCRDGVNTPDAQADAPPPSDTPEVATSQARPASR